MLQKLYIEYDDDGMYCIGCRPFVIVLTKGGDKKRRDEDTTSTVSYVKKK